MLCLLAQTTQPSLPDIASWQSFALQIINMIGIVGVAAIGVIALLKSKANETGLIANGQRIDDQHDRLESQQATLNVVQQAMPTAPAAPPKVNVQLDHAALATAMTAALVAAGKSVPTWPKPSAEIPQKASS